MIVILESIWVQMKVIFFGCVENIITPWQYVCNLKAHYEPNPEGGASVAINVIQSLVNIIEKIWKNKPNVLNENIDDLIYCRGGENLIITVWVLRLPAPRISTYIFNPKMGFPL